MIGCRIATCLTSTTVQGLSFHSLTIVPVKWANLLDIFVQTIFHASYTVTDHLFVFRLDLLRNLDAFVEGSKRWFFDRVDFFPVGKDVLVLPGRVGPFLVGPDPELASRVRTVEEARWGKISSPVQ